MDILEMLDMGNFPPSDDEGTDKMNIDNDFVSTLLPNDEVNGDSNLLLEVENSLPAEPDQKDENMVVNSTSETTVSPVRYITKRTLKYQCPISSLEPLPEDWVMVSHKSGIPVYLNKKTKVVTLSRPYVVAAGNVKKHNIPISSIPCLDYLKTVDRFNQVTTSNENTPSEITNGQINEDQVCTENNTAQNASAAPAPNNEAGNTAPVLIKTPTTEHIDDIELEEYLNKRFMFETTQIPHFEKWADKRKFVKKQKEAIENEGAPKKLGPAKVITLSIPRDGDSDKPHKLTFSTSVKPMICILHEYAQSVLRTKPHYIFATNEDASDPFQATIVLNEKNYGTASGINKKSAKNKAALLTMEMLVPGFKEQVESLSNDQSLEYFDEVSITDPRVYELCVHAGNFLPHQLLTECLKRNQGIADTAVQFDVQVGKSKMIEYKMTCGKHVVAGTAKNKKVGKHLASQQILKLLHPNMQTWGELIHVYGTSVAEKRARKKNIEQEIFELKQRRNLDSGQKSSNKDEEREGDSQEKKNALAPNPELLNKLKDMMMALEQESSSKKRPGEPDTDQPSKKRNKLLLIDV
ncbi:microprocessor complex subunit DGCR8 [Ciona intestinalis]